MSHTTVHIEIHRVINAPAQEATYRHGKSVPAAPAKREDVEVVNLTARVDGVNSAALESAINKAVAHLNCERPVIERETD